MNSKFKEWEILSKIGEGGFGDVYKAKNKEGFICAIKHISLPKNSDEIDLLLKSGVIKNKNDVNIYYSNFIKNIENEIKIMKNFNFDYNIVSYYGFYKEIRSDSNGYDFYILMEYLNDITNFYNNKKIDTNEVIKLGVDICTALEICSSNNIIHNDIKPSNIFISNDGKYKLGDFGIASNMKNNQLRGMGTLDYISPETYNNKKVTSSTDLYSLGLVMYKLISGNLPFVTSNIDEKAAFNIRMTGKKIPNIDILDKNLMNVLIKACNFNSNSRYKSATEMKKDLQKLSNINSEEKIVNFSSMMPQKTINIFDTKTIANISNKNKYIEKIKNSDLAVKIKNCFSKNAILKIVLLSSISCILGLFFIKCYALNRSCDNGYINRNGSCVKGYYYCDNDYMLNDDNKCQKTIESKKAKVTYTCKDGYTVSGEICVSNDIRDSIFVNKCADGFTLNGTKCEKEESTNATVIYSCSKGYVSSGDKCLKVTNVNASVIYTCPDSSYTLLGTTCKANGLSTVKASVTYTCSSGTLKDAICEQTTTPYFYWCSKGTYNYSDDLCHYTEPATPSYYCSLGTSDGAGNCIISSNTTVAANSIYSCPSGYAIVGNMCAKTSDINATITYGCTSASVLKGSKCYTTITTDSVNMYECDEGFIVSGTKCYKNSFPTAIKKYTCSRVYTLNEDKCEKYEIIFAKEHYEE